MGSLGLMAAGIGSVSGCIAPGTDSTVSAPPLVETRPDAVYLPSHIEGMQMVGMGTAGEYSIALMYSFPHRFWTVTGSRPSKVSIQPDDSVHLMASVWDEETGTVLPVASGISTTVTRNGDEVARKPPWPMISQNMGFHYGDNYKLSGDGTYRVEVEIGSMNIRKMGEFEGRFQENVSTEIRFEYSEAEKEEIMFRSLDNAGERAAVDLMEMENVPSSVAPTTGELPGNVQGIGMSGDADFVVTTLDSGRYVGDGVYVAVSPRTPYNNIVLPMMSLSAELRRGNNIIHTGDLASAVDHELGYHYGTEIPSLEAGDVLTVNVDTPPQVSRHEGYETAFLDVGSMEFEIET